MKTLSLALLKKELKHQSPEQLELLCLQLAKYKKENKELLTYLLQEAGDENHYVNQIKDLITFRFQEINTNSTHYIKKGFRRILRETKKYIKYSLVKETEIELLIHYCHCAKDFRPSIKDIRAMEYLYERQLVIIEKKLLLLHEDLQYDYNKKMLFLKNL